MKNFNPLKIGKYTFWVSFIIGNIFMFGGIISAFIPSLSQYYFVVGGYYYLFIASAINILIIIFINAYCRRVEVKEDIYLKAIGYIISNIPIAAIYACIGMEYVI